MQVQTGVSYLREIAPKTIAMDEECSNLTSEQGGTEVFKHAFGELRRILPLRSEDFENLSELDILKLAMDYIHDLEQILQREEATVSRATEIKGWVDAMPLATAEWHREAIYFPATLRGFDNVGNSTWTAPRNLDNSALSSKIVVLAVSHGQV